MPRLLRLSTPRAFDSPGLHLQLGPNPFSPTSVRAKKPWSCSTRPRPRLSPVPRPESGAFLCSRDPSCPGVVTRSGSSSRLRARPESSSAGDRSPPPQELTHPAPRTPLPRVPAPPRPTSPRPVPVPSGGRATSRHPRDSPGTAWGRGRPGARRRRLSVGAPSLCGRPLRVLRPGRVGPRLSAPLTPGTDGGVGCVPVVVSWVGTGRSETPDVWTLSNE